MSRKKELLEIDADEPEMLHATLSKLPKPLNLESLIRRTSEIFEQYPPERLPGRAWNRVSVNSVLKTTHDPHKLAQQTLADGEVMFEKQAAEIKRAAEWKEQKLRLWQLARKYRRPATYTGAAIVAAILAYWLRSGGEQAGFASWMPMLAKLRQQTVSVLHTYFL